MTGLENRAVRLLLAGILAIYLILALAYGVANPLFEAPDEHQHFFTALYIAERGRLPRVEPAPDPWLGQEAAQPPLYYLAGGLLVTPVAVGPARDQVWPNPFVRLGDAGNPTNVNAFVHGPWEGWPWRGYVLAVHLLRAFSTVLGLGTLLALYGSARLLWPARPGRALLATALIAFLPQFLFLHSAVSNDPAIIFLAAAALYQLLAIWFREASRGRLLLLGVTVGLAMLAKTAGLLLLVYAVAFLLVNWWRQSSRKSAGAGLLYVIVPALLIGGWILWRNWTLYGDPTAANQFVRVAGGDRGYSLWQALGELPAIWHSFFAVFGWFNVAPPRWIYWIWDGLVLLSVAGAGYGLAVQRARQQASTRLLLGALLAGWVALVLAGLLNFMMQTPAAQGRLLFPALVPLVLALAYGIDRFPWRGLVLAAPVLALVTVLYSLLFVIPQAYARPPLIEEAAIPGNAALLQRDLGQGIELVAAIVETERTTPGEVVWMTLFWRASPAPAVAPEVVVEIFGQEGEERPVGKLHSYHGGGLYPASLWPAGPIVASRIGVRLEAGMAVPTEAYIQIGLAGELVRVDVGALKVVPASWPEVPAGELARIGDGVRLVEASLGQTVARPGEILVVDVIWQVVSAPGHNLVTLVHLGDPAQPPLAQGDSVPLGGYYPTSRWEAGEQFADRYTLVVPDALPPGRYPVNVGMYRPDTLQRLPLTAGAQRQAHDVYQVGVVVIEQ